MSNLPLRSAPRQRRQRRNAVYMPSINLFEGLRPTPYKAKKRKSAEDCPICLKEYSENEEVVFLHGPNGAKHYMCTDCFSRMGESYNPDKCPICRQTIFSVQSSFGRCVYLQKVKKSNKKNH